MKTSFASYHELTEELAKLPKPAPGLVRVYRGQTKDFGVMLPTGLRAKADARDPIWQYCAMAIARELSPRTQTAPDEDSPWVEAIAQHYGPGSSLLDVTRSIDIALWFALHERLPVSADHLVGPPGQPDKARDIPLKETWWEYRPSTADGYLYVFDVPEWNGSNAPSHGSLLDLSSRRILSKSTRIQAQSACLVAGDPSTKGGDLRDFYVCEPIPVSWPMSGARRINDLLDVLFPDPSEDPWYSFFLSVPLTWIVEAGSRTLKLSRPLEVASYFYSSKTKIGEISRRTKFISPNPFYPAIEEGLSMNLSRSREFRLSEATRILFEVPLLHWFLTYSADMWNQAILAGDMSEQVDALPPTSGAAHVPLTNVFLEFSPLENTDWDHLTGKVDYDIQPLRAVWLVRDGSQFGFYLFPQQVTALQAKNYGAGPFVYAFDQNLSVFSRRDPGKTTLVKADWQIPRDKAFWIALAVLRFLSPIPKCDPSPRERIAQSNGNSLMTIPIRGAVARLMEVTEASSDRYWYVPRDASTTKPFFPGAVTATVEVLQLEVTGSWSQADAAHLRRLLQERFSQSN